MLSHAKYCSWIPHEKPIYVMKRREAQENSTDVDNGNFLIFSFPVYALLDPGSTFSMVTPIVAN